jgi:hypothetical protein
MATITHEPSRVRYAMSRYEYKVIDTGKRV